MPRLADIFVGVQPDARSLPRDMRNALDKTNPAKLGQDQGHKFSGGFGSGLKRLVGVAAGVLAGIQVKNFLAEANRGYREHLALGRITTQVIKTTGGAANITAAQVGKLADAIELKTGIDGDAIQSGANLLLTFTNLRNETGKGNQIFTQATGLLADMSAALGQDTKSSAIQLGKALNDPVKGITALSRVGVSFTAGQIKQVKAMVAANNVLGAQKLILGELQKEFGGAAAAAADPMARATVAYRQFQDQVGSVTLPIVNSLAAAFANNVAPAMIAVATVHGPAVTKFFTDLAPKIGASLGLFITGDFNAQIGRALGGLKPDSPYVAGTLAIRNGLISVKDALVLLATGNVTVDGVFGQGVSPGFIDFLSKVHTGLAGIYDTLRFLATGNYVGTVFGQAQGSGFVDFLVKARDALGQLVTNIQNFNWGNLKSQGGDVVDSLGKLLPLVGEFRDKMPGLTDVINVGVSALGFLADHTETLRKALPFLVAAVIAYKVAQSLANVAALIALPTKIAEVVVNRQLVASNRALIASRAGDVAATTGLTAATFAETSAKNVGIFASLRMRAAMIGHAIAAGAVRVATAASTAAQWLFNAAMNSTIVASVRARVAALAGAAASAVVRGATIAWTAAQWLLNVALTANPIGLVIAAIALLAIGFVLAWKKSETFRKIVTDAFRSIRNVSITVISFVWSVISGFFADLLNGAAKAFGWVPGLGGKLRGAATAFGQFRDSVNNKLNGLKDQTVNVTPNIKNVTFKGHTVPMNLIGSFGRFATGGKAEGFQVRGPGGPTEDKAGLFALSNKEWVINAAASAAQGDKRMALLNAGKASIVPDAYAATGGKAGVLLHPRMPTPGAYNLFGREVAAHTATAARPVVRAAAQAAAQGILDSTYAGGDPGPPGRRVHFRGVTLNQRTIRMLLNAERILGAVFRIMQGSYSTRVAASGGTHAGGGAMDTNGPRGWDIAVRALRQAGFAAWHRTPAMGPWGHHIHSIALGDPTASPAAKRQMVSFRRGGTGLGMAGGGKVDDFMRREFLSRMGIKTFDSGGRWAPHTLGANTSNQTETVIAGGNGGIAATELSTATIRQLADEIGNSIVRGIVANNHSQNRNALLMERSY